MNDVIDNDVMELGAQAEFLGSELKQSYFEQACKNIESAKSNQGGLRRANRRCGGFIAAASSDRRERG